MIARVRGSIRALLFIAGLGLAAPATATAITPGGWRSVPYSPGHYVELTLLKGGRAIGATNSQMHADPGYCGWGGSLKEQATEPARRTPIGAGASSASGPAGPATSTRSRARSRAAGGRASPTSRERSRTCRAGS